MCYIISFLPNGTTDFIIGELKTQGVKDAVVQLQQEGKVTIKTFKSSEYAEIMSLQDKNLSFQVHSEISMKLAFILLAFKPCVILSEVATSHDFIQQELTFLLIVILLHT